MAEGNPVQGFARLAKLPLELLAASLETMAAAARRVQQVYSAGLDQAVAGMERRPPVAAAPKRGVAAPSGGPPAAAAGAGLDLVGETFDGLIAFVVPGPDPYSVAQGVSTAEPGGIAAGVTGALIHSFNVAVPTPPGAPPPAVAVAGLLNQLAQKVRPAAAAGAGSPFAQLPFAEKAAVFGLLEKEPELAQFRVLAGQMLYATAGLAYSEYSVYDFADRCLTGRPVGWAISRYPGVANGHDEFKGYFEDRRGPQPSPPAVRADTWEGGSRA